MSPDHRGPLEGVELGPLIWASGVLVCVIGDSDGLVVNASPSFIAQARLDPRGRALRSVVSPYQSEAFASWLSSVGPTWTIGTWGAFPDENGLPQDYSFAACRRPDGGWALVGEPLTRHDVARALLDVQKEMVVEHRRLDHELNALDKVARQDSLTGVATRRAFDAQLAAIVATAGPGKPFSVVMIDIDHFKGINDEYGHPTGDAVLRWLGSMLGAAARRRDFVARYGGEEFVAILGDARAPDAAAWAERLRLAISAAAPPGVSKRVTVSLGVAEWRPEGDVVQRADQALYAAKRAGRDRVGRAP